MLKKLRQSGMNVGQSPLLTDLCCDLLKVLLKNSPDEFLTWIV